MCGKESESGLQLVEKLATPLAKRVNKTDWFFLAGSPV